MGYCMVVYGEYGEDASCLYGCFEEQKELELRREAGKDRRQKTLRSLESQNSCWWDNLFSQVDFSVLWGFRGVLGLRCFVCCFGLFFFDR